LGLVTLRPLLPERSLPCFIAFISRSTDFEAPELYFLPDFLADLRAVLLAVPLADFRADFFAGLLDAFRGDFARDFLADVFLDGAIVFPLQVGSSQERQGCAPLRRKEHSSCTEGNADPSASLRMKVPQSSQRSQ
jgi:hypothetical protein